MVFLNGSLAFKVLMGMLLKVPIKRTNGYFRKFFLFFFCLIKNPGSSKCIYKIQWLIFSFAGNTIRISTLNEL